MTLRHSKSLFYTTDLISELMGGKKAVPPPTRTCPLSPKSGIYGMYKI